MALSAPDRTRLTKLLGLLASDHVGERAAAAAKASELVKRCGTTWADLIGIEPVPSQPQAGASYQQQPGYGGSDLAHCLRHLGAVTAWEAQFVQSLQRRPRRTAKQLATLAGIAADLRKRGLF